MLRGSIWAKVIGFFALGLCLLFAVSVRAAQQKAEREEHTAPDAAAHAPAEPAAGKHAAAEDAAHSSGDVNPLKIEPTLAFWTFVVFVGLLFVLGRFAWKPLLEALHRREQHLEHVLLETERARNESEGLLAEHRRLMAKAAEEVRDILDKGRQAAQAAADRIVKEAQTEAEAARDRATREIGSARDQALAEIWEKTADIAVSVAGRVLEKQLSGDDHRRLLENAIAALPEVAKRNGHKGPPA
jgi:F-type H+-transporting ATPase subunit b